MPVPWKKGRISQLVADHLQSPKRGGSLVVETGFPTSLIDLFVKNRDRLKKPSKKRRFEVSDPMLISPLPPPKPSQFSPNSGVPSPRPSQVPPKPSQLSPNSAVPSPKPLSPKPLQVPPKPLQVLPNSSLKPLQVPPKPLQVSPNSGVPSLPLQVSSSSGVTVSEFGNPKGSASSPIGNEIVLQGDVVVGGDTVEDGVQVADAKRVFVAVLKISLVVVLALGTKRFAVGITMSAFLLFLLEYMGKHVCKLLKPCANTGKTLKSPIERILCFLRIKRDNSILVEEEIRGSKEPIRQKEPIVSGCYGLIMYRELDAPIEEIQIVQPKSNLVPPIEEIQCVRDEFETRGRDKKWVCERIDTKKGVLEKEEDCRSVSLEPEHRLSHRAKIRSKIKKLVPKKLRSKKKQPDLKSGATSSVEEDKVVECDEQELVDGDNLSSLSSGRYDEQDVNHTICSSDELLWLEVEALAVGEEGGRERERNSETERNSGYLILFLVVLVGLVGGRLLALGLTLSWCLMLKSTGTLRRFFNVPMFRSPAKISS